MPTLSENDPEPAGPSGPPVWLVALIVVIVFGLVVLHLTGVIGPG
jgi:antibiotic biosynthesis monooxygenase (ABM) superfamily enzyme